MSIFDTPGTPPPPPDPNFGETLAAAVVCDGPEVPMSGNRYTLPGADGKPVVWNGATALAGVLDNPYPLKVHGERQVARGMAIRPDLCAKVAADPADKTVLKSVLRDAKSAAAGEKEANWGTALHSVFRRHDEGAPLNQLPGMFHPDILARQAKLDLLGIKILPEYRERVVRCLALKVSGRLDGIAQLPDGTLVVVDDKSEEDPQKHTSAKKIQLAVYAYAGELMNYRTNEVEPMPDGLRLDFALIIHTRPLSGKCEIFEVNIMEGWAGAVLATQVREWQSRTGGIYPYVTERSWVPKEAVTQQHTESQKVLDRLTSVSVDSGEVYCWDCDHDTHTCKGCGTPLPHGESVCAACHNRLTHEDAFGSDSRIAASADCSVCREMLCPACHKCVSGQCPRTACVCESLSLPGEPEIWAPPAAEEEDVRSGVLTEPAIDPQTEAEELAASLKLDKSGWKMRAATVGVTDLNHHIRGANGLARLYVDARNALGMSEAQWRERQSTLALEPERYTEAQVIADLNAALTKEALRAVYDRWVAAHGDPAWSGAVLAAGVARMQVIRGATPVTTHPLA